MNNTTDPKNEEKVVPQEEWEINRNHHKSLADAAFRSADYKTAIQEYSSAITFDPDFHILYSNRSAAYLANGEKSRALADAKKCVSIQPDFVKGHNRLASSMLSLGRWNEARGVYRHILTNLDQGNEVARKGVEDCRIREQNAKQAQMEMTKLAQQAKERAEADAKAKADAQAKLETETKNINTPDESTDNDNADNENNHKQEDEEDDLLGEFFDEVEEVTTTKKASPEKSKEKDVAQPKNKIQIQMKELGDFNSQIQRLLRPNHDWYNFANPSSLTY